MTTPRQEAFTNPFQEIHCQISARSWDFFPVELVATTGGRVLLCERVDLKPIRQWARRDMLEEFLQLADADADDAAVATFGRRYGLLGLCRHGVPIGKHGAALRVHNFRSHYRSGSCPQAQIRHAGFPRYAEQTDHWRAFARRLATCIDAGEQLRRGQVLSRATMTAMFEGLLPLEIEEVLGASSERERRESQSWHFCRLMNSWLSIQAAIISDGDPSRLKLEYGPGDLLGALALQAALTATGLKQLVVCYNCGRPFWAKRLRSRGWRSYCDRYECGNLAAQRDAARDYRARRKKRRGLKGRARK